MYAQKALNIITDNPQLSALSRQERNLLNISIEQWYLWLVLNYYDEDITPFLDHCSYGETIEKGYTHMIGGLKGDFKNCRAMTEKLKDLFPDIHASLVSVFGKLNHGNNILSFNTVF